MLEILTPWEHSEETVENQRMFEKWVMGWQRGMSSLETTDAVSPWHGRTTGQSGQSAPNMMLHGCGASEKDRWRTQ